MGNSQQIVSPSASNVYYGYNRQQNPLSITSKRTNKYKNEDEICELLNSSPNCTSKKTGDIISAKRSREFHIAAENIQKALNSSKQSLKKYDEKVPNQTLNSNEHLYTEGESVSDEKAMTVPYSKNMSPSKLRQVDEKLRLRLSAKRSSSVGASYRNVRQTQDANYPNNIIFQIENKFYYAPSAVHKPECKVGPLSKDAIKVSSMTKAFSKVKSPWNDIFDIHSSQVESPIYQQALTNLSKAEPYPMQQRVVDTAIYFSDNGRRTNQGLSMSPTKVNVELYANNFAQPNIEYIRPSALITQAEEDKVNRGIKDNTKVLYNDSRLSSVSEWQSNGSTSKNPVVFSSFTQMKHNNLKSINKNRICSENDEVRGLSAGDETFRNKYYNELVENTLEYKSESPKNKETQDQKLIDQYQSNDKERLSTFSCNWEKDSQTDINPRNEVTTTRQAANILFGSHISRNSLHNINNYDKFAAQNFSYDKSVLSSSRVESMIHTRRGSTILKDESFSNYEKGLFATVQREDNFTRSNILIETENNIDDLTVQHAEENTSSSFTTKSSILNHEAQKPNASSYEIDMAHKQAVFIARKPPSVRSPKLSCEFLYNSDLKNDLESNTASLGRDEFSIEKRQTASFSLNTLNTLIEEEEKPYSKLDLGRELESHQQLATGEFKTHSTSPLESQFTSLSSLRDARIEHLKDFNFVKSNIVSDIDSGSFKMQNKNIMLTSNHNEVQKKESFKNFSSQEPSKYSHQGKLYEELKISSPNLMTFDGEIRRDSNKTSDCDIAEARSLNSIKKHGTSSKEDNIQPTSEQVIRKLNYSFISEENEPVEQKESTISNINDLGTFDINLRSQTPSSSKYETKISKSVSLSFHESSLTNKSKIDHQKLSSISQSDEHDLEKNGAQCCLKEESSVGMIRNKENESSIEGRNSNFNLAFHVKAGVSPLEERIGRVPSSFTKLEVKHTNIGIPLYEIKPRSRSNNSPNKPPIFQSYEQWQSFKEKLQYEKAQNDDETRHIELIQNIKARNTSCEMRLVDSSNDKWIKESVDGLDQHHKLQESKIQQGNESKTPTAIRNIYHQYPLQRLSTIDLPILEDEMIKNISHHEMNNNTFLLKDMNSYDKLEASYDDKVPSQNERSTSFIDVKIKEEENRISLLSSVSNSPSKIRQRRFLNDRASYDHQHQLCSSIDNCNTKNEIEEIMILSLPHSSIKTTELKILPNHSNVQQRSCEKTSKDMSPRNFAPTETSNAFGLSKMSRSRRYARPLPETASAKKEQTKQHVHMVHKSQAISDYEKILAKLMKEKKLESKYTNDEIKSPELSQENYKYSSKKQDNLIIANQNPEGLVKLNATKKCAQHYSDRSDPDMLNLEGACPLDDHILYTKDCPNSSVRSSSPTIAEGNQKKYGRAINYGEASLKREKNHVSLVEEIHEPLYNHLYQQPPILSDDKNDQKFKFYGETLESVTKSNEKPRHSHTHLGSQAYPTELKNQIQKNRLGFNIHTGELYKDKFNNPFAADHQLRGFKTKTTSSNSTSPNRFLQNNKSSELDPNLHKRQVIRVKGQLVLDAAAGETYGAVLLDNAGETTTIVNKYLNKSDYLRDSNLVGKIQKDTKRNFSPKNTNVSVERNYHYYDTVHNSYNQGLNRSLDESRPHQHYRYLHLDKELDGRELSPMESKIYRKHFKESSFLQRDLERQSNKIDTERKTIINNTLIPGHQQNTDNEQTIGQDTRRKSSDLDTRENIFLATFKEPRTKM